MTQTLVSVDDAVDAFKRLMATLQAARSKRGADPWSQCPLTMPQLRALSFIGASEHGLSSRELATLLGVGASAVTPLVDRLVDHAFVLRHEDEHDRRVARLYATDSGKAVLEQMVSGKGDVMREALSTLTPDQLQLVARAFDVLRAALNQTEGISH